MQGSAGKQNIVSLLPEELEAALAAMGEPKFRARQVFQWLSRGVRDFSQMSNLPKALREKLGEGFLIYAPRVLSKQVSALDGTIKYLWELSDGNAVETVVMRYKHGNPVCISSQVGCRQGCAFCASTIGGLVRDLQAGEILDEVLFSQLDSGMPISNIVLMGIGEPLDNFENVLRFLRLVNHPDGMNIGMDALIAACREYYEQTGRRISFEYAMIDGVNDSAEQARLLAGHARAVAAHVNLIPLNHVQERPFRPSTPEHMKEFIRILEQQGVNVTVRRKLGGDVDASCGQLRRKMQTKGGTGR